MTQSGHERLRIAAVFVGYLEPLFLVCMFTDIGPEIVNLVGGKDALPRRHGFLSMLNRIDKTGMLIGRQASQIKSDS
jgi:hypothetical protein